MIEYICSFPQIDLFVIQYLVNNNGTMEISQSESDGAATVHIFHNQKSYNDISNDITLPAGDMVMLINFYRYIKRNDIKNDFINPDGKNHE